LQGLGSPLIDQTIIIDSIGSHLMPHHSVSSQLQEKSLLEMVVAILKIPVAKFTTSVALQFLKETYCKDWDVRSWT
jgi:hypothetical protein